MQLYGQQNSQQYPIHDDTRCMHDDLFTISKRPISLNNTKEPIGDDENKQLNTRLQYSPILSATYLKYHGYVFHDAL